jgi:hypothetical protein
MSQFDVIDGGQLGIRAEVASQPRGEAVSATGLSSGKSIAIILAVAALVFLPIAIIGIPDGYDLMQHMRFAETYRSALLNGNLVPTWSALDNYGFGGIGTRYYPPLAYYALAITRILTGSWYHSFWMTSYFWGALGSVGVYLWLKEWSSNRSAILAAIMYAVIPYHTFQLYQAVLYAEFAAAGVVPFCFLFLTRFCRRDSWIDAAAFSLVYGLLILAHIPTAIIATASIGLYALFVLDFSRFGSVLVKGVVAVAFSGAIAAFHLAKAILEVDWVKHNSPRFYGSGYYDYKIYFFPMYFVADAERYTAKMLWHFDTIITITLASFVFAIAFWVFFGTRSSNLSKDGLKVNRAVFVTGGIALFMLSAASAVLWNNLPVLSKIQFPWRWLSVASLMGSAAFGIASGAALVRNGLLNRRAAYPALVFIVVAGLYMASQNILPSAPLAKAEFDKKIAGMQDEPGCECWWPVWAQASALDDRRLTGNSGVPADVTRWDAGDRTFTVLNTEPSILRVPTFFHPRWTATVDGTATEVVAGTDGAINIATPAGVSSISLRFVEPPALKGAEFISLAAWIVLLAGIILLIYNGRRRSTPLMPGHADA